MKDKHLKMYEDLLEQENTFDEYGLNNQRMTPYDYDDDGEEFITSKEIIEQQKIGDNRLGIPTGSGNGTIEEYAHFKRYSKKREHKYTDKEMEEIRESCMTTIVHDYAKNEIFHMSDEDRAKNDELLELRGDLSKLKSTYRKVDEYIIAMRTVVKAWEILERTNYIHSKEEFYELVGKGIIYSRAIIMPKLKGINKYNMETIMEYISNSDLDPSALMPSKDPEVDEFYGLMSIDDDEERFNDDQELMYYLILSPEEREYVVDHRENPEEMEVRQLKYKYVKGYDETERVRKKRLKKFKKIDREYVDDVHAMLRKLQETTIKMNNNYQRSRLVTNSIFEKDEMDKSPWDDIKFQGSWQDDAAVRLFEIQNYIEHLNMRVPGYGRNVTYAHKALNNLLQALEGTDVNVLEFRRRLNMDNQSLTAEEQKRSKKENKKMEDALMQRVIKLNGSHKFKKVIDKSENSLSTIYRN